MNISNNIQLIGALEKPPLYVTTDNGADLTRFELVTERKQHVWSNKKLKAITDCHQCVVWGPAALVLHEHLDRGSRLAIKGELCYGIYEQDKGDSVIRAEIHLTDFTFLDVRR